ncbi:MAG: hypothetical protein LKCHEGNO_00267 [Burkholderiaceae bacterium]|nr:hypothetical protein [Burkholderiaceae bacterium]
MKANDLATEPTSHEPTAEVGDRSLLRPLLASAARAATADAELHGVFVGELVALQQDEDAAFVRCQAVDPVRALRARATVDLHGAYIGREVTLVFERGDATRPIVTGVLRGQPGWSLPELPAQVDADGERLIVQAKDQLVLRCGKASVTLTKAGKVLIEGTYLSSRSTGVNRIKGGSVQLN